MVAWKWVHDDLKMSILCFIFEHVSILNNEYMASFEYFCFGAILSMRHTQYWRILFQPHLWRSGSALKIGRREVPGSISDRACRPSRSEFTVVFLRNSRKYGLGSLRKTHHRGHSTYGPRSLVWQSDLYLQPITILSQFSKTFFFSVLLGIFTWKYHYPGVLRNA